MIQKKEKKEKKKVQRQWPKWHSLLYLEASPQGQRAAPSIFVHSSPYPRVPPTSHEEGQRYCPGQTSQA